MYEPAEDSYLLQESVRRHALGRVLDMGTGSGIQALTAVENPNVKEVVAIDLDKEAIQMLREKTSKQRIRKIKVLQSNLFENVEGQFSTIFFNPPYLPQDQKVDGQEIEDKAIYGGKKGWEVSERFFADASRYLFPDGKIIFLFSSLTDRKKIDEIIVDNLFSFREISRKKLPFFEELFVYLIEKSSLLRELEKKSIEDIHYLTRGKRGVIYTGMIDRSKQIKTHLPGKRDLIKVAVKTKREDSKAQERIRNEVKWLKILNRKGIGPKLLFHGKDYFVYRFVEGKFILEWVKDVDKRQIVKVLVSLLKQCYVMDEKRVNKEEMHHPLKHVIVDSGDNPVLIDFERCRQTDRPHNVTQFIEFTCRLHGELERKGFVFSIEKIRVLAHEYKNSMANGSSIVNRSFQKIIQSFQ